ncbi:MAG: hypothetical protein ABIK39_03890 [candidate division WOR-3 bacterium]
MKRLDRVFLLPIVGTFMVLAGTNDVTTKQAANRSDKVKVVQTRRVVIEDEVGKVRAEIAADEKEPDIILYDSDGDGCVALDEDKGGSGLEVYDEKGRTRLRMSATGIEIYDGNEKPQVRWSASGLKIYDEKGKVRLFWSGLGLGLFDEKGRLRLRLSAE